MTDIQKALADVFRKSKPIFAEDVRALTQWEIDAQLVSDTLARLDPDFNAELWEASISYFPIYSNR